jgi:hypothetical protein
VGVATTRQHWLTLMSDYVGDGGPIIGQPHEVLVPEADIAGLLAVRGSAYGSPLINHERISDLWSAYLRITITPEQAAMCMALVKVARLVQSPDHADSIHDLAGYVEVYRQIINEKQ